MDVGRGIGENLAGSGWVLVESGLDDVGGGVAVGRLLVGLFPVAFAVPEGAGLVVGPEGVVFGPDAVVEGDVFFALVGGARGEPLDGGEETSVFGIVELKPLFTGASSSDGGVVLGGLVAVVFV